ncbi:MAG: ABC-2 family transporter protein [Patescibacteria group bacterium]|nr:ABC-2 family transporter protein [Patescibacteria group bacterium]
MKKYWAGLVIALKEDTVYSTSVLAWRVRNVMQVLVVYILWAAILVSPGGFADYSKSLLLSYVLLTMMIRAVVFSSRTIDVSSDISSGDITNILLKPVNYFRYYFAQDLGNKAMNLFFSVIEFSVFIYFFKPPLYGQYHIFVLVVSALLLILAAFIYYYVNLILGFLAFYTPENVWAPRFLFFMILDFLAGALFPLDILPKIVFKFLMLTPFPYFLYFPIAVYLGRFWGLELLGYSLVGVFWLLALWRFSGLIWQAGLKVYEAWGR